MKISNTILFIFLFLITPCVFSQDKKTEETFIITPEGMGEHLYELLIGRADLKKSPTLLNLDEIYNDKTKAQFEDSPAFLIVALLAESQNTLLSNWDRLLYNADSLNINSNTKFVKTVFTNQQKDQYRVVSIFIMPDSTYGYIEFITIKWDGKDYLFKISDCASFFKARDEMDSFYFFDQKETLISDEEDINLSPSTYPYNNININPLKEYTVPSMDNLKKTLLQAMKEGGSMIDPDLLLTEEEIVNLHQDKSELTTDSILLKLNLINTPIEKAWGKIIDFTNSKKTEDINVRWESVENFYKDNVYMGVIVFFLSENYKSYCCSLAAVLVDNKWKLLTIEPFKEEELPFSDFKF